MPRILLLAIAPDLCKLFNVPVFPPKPAEFLADIIERTVKARKLSGERRNDIIDLIVDEMDKDRSSNFTLEEKDLIMKANSLILFSAGFDTSAISMAKVITNSHFDWTRGTTQ